MKDTCLSYQTLFLDDNTGPVLCEDLGLNVQRLEGARVPTRSTHSFQCNVVTSLVPSYRWWKNGQVPIILLLSKKKKEKKLIPDTLLFVRIRNLALTWFCFYFIPVFWSFLFKKMSCFFKQKHQYDLILAIILLVVLIIQSFSLFLQICSVIKYQKTIFLVNIRWN